MSNFCRQIRVSSTLIRVVKYKITRSFTTIECHRPSILHKKGVDIIHDPWFNKGTAFSMTERDRLELRGLLPPNVQTEEQQIARFMTDLKKLERNARDGPSDSLSLAKWRILNRLHDRNETMYYKVLLAHIKEYAPIVYTPTVGLVCQKYSGLFRRPRGMYFSAADRGEMMAMVYNWPADQVHGKTPKKEKLENALGDLHPEGMHKCILVDMIVVTDGSRVMGLGDLGVQGIGIAIGKLDLYVAAAGINPQRGQVQGKAPKKEKTEEHPRSPPSGRKKAASIVCMHLCIPVGWRAPKVLPIMIDVGTNNETLLEDPLYLGLQEHRLEGEEYLSIMDELMEALFNRWPHVIVQFEDFQRKWASKLLERYRNTYRMFNDDVQGTAGVAVAGLLGALRAQQKMMIDFPKQNIVVVGAGSAGIGVLKAARRTMARILGNNENAFESARSQFWVVDVKGLITEEREDIDHEVKPFARKTNEIRHRRLREGASLVEVLQEVKPDVLLGLSAVGGLFNKEVLEAFRGSTSTRPAIFAMSTPKTNVECTPEEAFSIVGKHMIFASGNPLEDVNLGNGQIGYCNQGNNMYLFPGIGLGTLLSGARTISDGMLQAAAECLAECMTEDEVLKGIIYPPISRIRDITKKVAVAVITEAIEEDLVDGYREMNFRDLRKLTKEEILLHVENNMWKPDYPTLIYKDD